MSASSSSAWAALPALAQAEIALERLYPSGRHRSGGGGGGGCSRCLGRPPLVPAAEAAAAAALDARRPFVGTAHGTSVGTVGSGGGSSGTKKTHPG